MRSVAEIYEFIKRLAPEHMAMDWDHVGLLCGHSDAAVTKVLVALDPFLPVAQEAKRRGAELIVTHHPAIWRLDALNDGTPAGQALLYLAENKIAAINAHTNLDCAPGGVNDCLAKSLQLCDIRVIDPAGTDDEGREFGLLRGGRTKTAAPAAFAMFVKQQLNCIGLRYADGGKPIQKVAVGGGACAEYLERVSALGYDCFVTADVKYNAFADAKALGITLIDAGHFHTENPVCAAVCERLAVQFPDMEVLLSETHCDCITYL